MAKLYRNIFLTFSSLCIMVLIIHPTAGDTVKVHNVLTFGAKSDGLTDSTKQFFSAWSAACNEKSPVMIVVPKGRYLLHPITFHGGDCNNTYRITFYVSGTLVAPLNFRVLGKAPAWLDFRWASNTLSFTNSENIVLKGVTSLNSQLYHIVINGCKNVHIEGVKIRAPGNSPNTDGIHIQFSSPVTILNTAIKTGDDCISIGPGTKNLLIDHVACGPGHGISIGSLARDDDEEGVENVTVKTAVFAYSTNGLRIKSWAQPGNGFVRGIVFQDVLMRNVANPIIIDQNYCPYHKNCPDQESGVKVSDVKYRGIRGTSTTQVAIKLDCSASDPCTGITLENVNLTYHNQPAEAFCNNAVGKALGLNDQAQQLHSLISAKSDVTAPTSSHNSMWCHKPWSQATAFLKAWNAACATVGPPVIELVVFPLSVLSLMQKDQPGGPAKPMEGITLLNAYAGRAVDLSEDSRSAFPKCNNNAHVQNPMIMDRHYCPQQVSGIKISNVTYDGVQGT
ncbi:hypothetical protein Cgig2_020193 [Carnegiea gigantea]|uniref:Polygalacturonase n=1 Tax=Carnegiea gigantea TaxID=171969 RepID=A0A9Q1QR25_9CARY|nr:hypothetical protein Cgig2_020193 [Carnegiea gigantea]